MPTLAPLGRRRCHSSPVRTAARIESVGRRVLLGCRLFDRGAQAVATSRPYRCATRDLAGTIRGTGSPGRRCRLGSRFVVPLLFAPDLRRAAPNGSLTNAGGDRTQHSRRSLDDLRLATSRNGSRSALGQPTRSRRNNDRRTARVRPRTRLLERRSTRDQARMAPCLASVRVAPSASATRRVPESVVDDRTTLSMSTSARRWCAVSGRTAAVSVLDHARSAECRRNA